MSSPTGTARSFANMLNTYKVINKPVTIDKQKAFKNAYSLLKN